MLWPFLCGPRSAFSPKRPQTAAGGRKAKGARVVAGHSAKRISGLRKGNTRPSAGDGATAAERRKGKAMSAKHRQQLTAAIEIMNVIVEIVQSQPQGVPSGYIYAAVMGTMSLDTYQRMIDLLIEAGKIKQSNHLLTAV